MTSQELWRDVGRFLRDQREDQGYTWTAIATAAGIDRDTVKAIERGEPGRVDKLDDLLQALGLSIVDVLNEVLKPAEARSTLEAATLLRTFDRLGVVDRGILLVLAKRMLEQHEARPPEESPAPTAAPPPGLRRGPRRKAPPTR